ncbi:serine/threonine-protein kinase [Beijerinckia mobilis]|uniref:serine/threonine-protein kinase n=1 Tax=Beijerinckia mobilis TaxID=231434 RepID=UPI00069223E4|nr:serine/threonine-protein kinase [Beijerinckia mobilis]
MSNPSAILAFQGPLPPGTRLNDNYEIDVFLKSGGMGDVYRGHEIQTGDSVAIKLIREQLAGDETMLAMFRNEALALRRIHHEAIVRYFGFTFEPQLRRHYLTMEFIEGTPLSEILQKRALTVAETLALRRRLALGLQAAHDQTVFHRDVSPDNVIVPDSGIERSRIIDFGIARSLRVGDVTVIGSGFAGKFKYVSPEQVGHYGGDVRAPSDIYSLGLVLAECLIGTPLPMDGSQAEIVEKRRQVPDLSAVDPVVRPLIESMLQPDPTARPKSMAEIATWKPGSAAPLDATIFAPRFSNATALPAIPVPHEVAPPRTPIKQERPSFAVKEMIAASAALLLLGAAIGGWLWFKGQPGSTTRTETTAVPPGKKAEPAGDGPRLDPVVRIRQYVRDFDGGDCFLAVAGTISADSVEIDGFGREREPFDALDRSFKDVIGAQATISLRKVVSAQCPVLAFAKRFLATVDPPRFDVERARLIYAGDRLEGTIDARADHVYFLIVDDSGQVSDFSDHLGGEPGRRDFAMELRSSRPGPVLLVAIETRQPITIGASAKAQDLFVSLTQELSTISPPPAVAVHYVSLVPGN